MKHFFSDFFLFYLLASAVAVAADPAPSTAPAQAVIANVVHETDLTTVTLTPEAVRRLGIATVPITKKPVRHLRLYGGEVTLPLAVGADGAALTALAPPQNAAETLKLAELQIAAEGEISQARVKLEAAQLTLSRAEKLFVHQTGSERAVEEARTARQLAQAVMDQAVAKRALLGPGLADASAGDRWWIRVAIFSADAGALDGQAIARVTPPGADRSLMATRVVEAPGTANALTATVDWYYEIKDPPRERRSGERVEVRVPVAASGEEQLVAPRSAVLHDIHGGEWVYEMTAPTTFVRRRVQVLRIAKAEAVLATGPDAGAKIVTDGAAELFGIEFGPGK